jgi:hypothetical protein
MDRSVMNNNLILRQLNSLKLKADSVIPRLTAKNHEAHRTKEYL